MAEHWHRGPYLLTTDPDALDINALHAFLRESYWAHGIPLEVLQRSLAHSLSFTLLREHDFVGFARVVTDYATFAYLADVFVLPAWRGQGLGTWMISCLLAHSQLQGLRRWCLVTRDAQPLYARVGFEQTQTPQRWMERLDPQVYARGAQRDTP